jgi:hypothetical protein
MKLGLQPGSAGENLRVARLLVNASFAALRWGPLEVFHNVCDIHLVPIDAGLSQTLVEEFSGRSNEWSTGTIFLIPRLLAHQHDGGSRISLAKDSLCGSFPKIARFARSCLLS